MTTRIKKENLQNKSEYYLTSSQTYDRINYYDNNFAAMHKKIEVTYEKPR